MLDELTKELEDGTMSPLDVQRKLSRIKDSVRDLWIKCEGLMQKEREEHSAKRMHALNKKYLLATTKIQLRSAWSDGVRFGSKGVIEQIKYTDAYEQGHLNNDLVEAYELPVNKSMVDTLKSLEKLILPEIWNK